MSDGGSEDELLMIALPPFCLGYFAFRVWIPELEPRSSMSAGRRAKMPFVTTPAMLLRSTSIAGGSSSVRPWQSRIKLPLSVSQFSRNTGPRRCFWPKVALRNAAISQEGGLVTHELIDRLRDDSAYFCRLSPRIGSARLSPSLNRR